MGKIGYVMLSKNYLEICWYTNQEFLFKAETKERKIKNDYNFLKAVHLHYLLHRIMRKANILYKKKKELANKSGREREIHRFLIEV